MSRHTFSRRQFLGWSTALAGASPLLLNACTSDASSAADAGPAAAPVRPTTQADFFDSAQSVAWDPLAIAEDTALFPMSVQSGSARAAAITLWGFAQDNAAKTLKVWRQDDVPGHVKMVHDALVEPTGPGLLRRRMESLAPDTVYSFAFITADQTARSAVGRFRMPYPADMRWPLTVLATTCTNFRFAPYQSLILASQQEADLLLHVGDMSYNDGCMTPEDYQARWRRTLTDPGYLALLKNQSSLIAWDDHEFENDLNPEDMDRAQMAAAKATFFSHLPMEPGPQGQLWQSFRWGSTAEFFVLDCRTERKPSTLDGTMQEYLSPAQMAWFKDALKASPCHFKVVLNSVPMVRFPDTFWANRNDRWQGYTAAREEILSFLEAQGLDNTWFISGDFHLGIVGRVEQQGFRRQLWDIAVGPGGNQGNPLGGLAASDPQLHEDIFPSAQFLYGQANIAMTRLTFDPLRDVVRVEFVDATTKEVLFDQELSRRT